MAFIAASPLRCDGSAAAIKGKENWPDAKERTYGSFSRTIGLPTTVDAQKIGAQFKDGVLQVTLPKSEAAKPKQIEVKVN